MCGRFEKVSRTCDTCSMKILDTLAREKSLLRIRILQKIFSETTNPWQISKCNSHGLLMFFTGKKHCPFLLKAVYNFLGLVKLYAPAVHRLKKWDMGNGYIPKWKRYTTLVNFRDMGYTRDIPKNGWYISFLRFFGIWNIPRISQKISSTYVFSVFAGYWIFKGYPQKITVHSLKPNLRSWDIPRVHTK